MRRCVYVSFCLCPFACAPALVCVPRCMYVRVCSRKTPTVGLEPTTTRLRAVRSAGWAKRAATSAAAQSANCKCATQLPPQFGPANAAELQRAIWRAEMDTLGIEPRAFRMRSGCDTTTPCARACCTPHNANPGYSSVGRASDCRTLQQSDGPWFDSGWPEFLCQRPPHGGIKLATNLRNIPPSGLEPGSLGWGPSIPTN